MRLYRWIGPTVITALSWSGLPPAVSTAEAAEPADLSAELAELRRTVLDQQRQIEALRGDKDAQWLNERRAEEVKALVREVLADADTRASLLNGGLTSGYNNGFFVGSEDGSFLLKVNGESQVRYLYSSRQHEPDGTDENEAGFQIRRSRLGFAGHFINPDLTYRLRLSYDRGSGALAFDDAWVAYDFADNWKVQLGQFKPQFIREESVGGFRQLAVERSYLADYFTVDYTQGVELSYSGDALRAYLAIHDGSYGLNTDFQSDRTDLAISGRAELLLAGDWKQFNDFTSWSSDKLGVLVGGGIAYEVGETGSGADTPDIIKYTADVSLELGGANVFAAVYAQRFNDNGDSPPLADNLDDACQIGFVVQGGLFVVPDKLELFGRYEWIDFDGVYYRNNGSSAQSGSGDLDEEDELGIVTVGGNWYFKKHNAKLTIDVLWALDPVPVANSGAGLLASADDDQVVLRSQFQFAF